MTSPDFETLLIISATNLLSVVVWVVVTGRGINRLRRDVRAFRDEFRSASALNNL